METLQGTNMGPILGKGKSSSKCHFWGDMLVPWKVFFAEFFFVLVFFLVAKKKGRKKGWLVDELGLCLVVGGKVGSLGGCVGVGWLVGLD